jgi:trk system potassium uptake protein TrkH
VRLPLVFGVVGQLLRVFSVAFLPPLLLALYDREWWVAVHFAVALVSCLLAGRFASRGLPGAPIFHRSEALAVVSLTWLSVGVFAAVPYLLSGYSPVDAMFESISGLTTTGATILTDFSAHGRAFYLWRAMTQWFGGLGVIALFVVVLPRLGIAGRQLFFAEASGAPSEAVSPQVRHSARRLWILYTVLTVVLVAALMGSGMTLYEGILHALTTMSAGGFSPHPGSIAGYRNPVAEWILVVFMMLAGTSFTLQYKVFTGRVFGFFRDGEFLFYFGFMICGALAVAFILSGGLPTVEEIRVGAFQAASLISSTGYASADFQQWPDAARAILVVVMLVGGCAGSAAGGPKSVRLLLVFKHASREITRVLHPRAVMPLRYSRRPIPDEIMRAVFMLVALFMVGYFAIGTLLVVLGADLVTGYSAALACLGNIGPAFGPAGPMGSYADFPLLSKILLIAAMWIGRLEIVTVLALLHRDVWRNIRFSSE